MERRDGVSDSLLEVFDSNTEVVVLCGAGISKSAGVPLGHEIVDILRDRYSSKFDDTEYEYDKAWETALPDEEHREDRRALFEEFIAGTSPTAEHHLLAHLVDCGFCTTVMTTNFDHLLEIGFNSVCSQNHRIYQYDTQLSIETLATDVPKLLKVHGDYLFRDIANLDYEMRDRVNQNMRAQLTEYLRDKALLVTGYSGSDSSVMELLQSCAETETGLAGGLYWTTYSGIDLESPDNEYIRRLVETMEANDKSVEIVGPTDSADFLTELTAELGVGEPEVSPFGVDASNVHVPNSYNTTFGEVMHQPPTYRPEIDGEIGPTVDRVRELVEIGPALIEGPSGTGFSEFCARFYNSLPTERRFYFNPVFSNGLPGSDLYEHLLDFADRLGCQTKQHVSSAETFRELFDRDATVVIDEVNDGTQGNFLAMVQTLVEAHNESEDGTLAIMRRTERDNLGVQRLRGPPTITSDRMVWSGEGVSESEQLACDALTAGCPEVEDALDRLDSSEREVLSLLSLLRRSEYPSNLVDLADVDERVFEELRSAGLVQSMNGRIMAHPVVVDRVTTTLSMERKQELHRRLGERFSTLAIDKETRVSTHVIEAEKHLWEAEEYAQGFQTILSLTQVTSGDPRFLSSTLAEYLQLASDGAEFFDALEPHEQLHALVVYYRVRMDTDHASPISWSVFYQLELTTLQGWSSAYRQAYYALIDLINISAVSALKELAEVVSTIKNDFDRELSGELKYRIGSRYLDFANSETPGRRSELSDTGIEWIKDARSDFEMVGRMVMVARCNDDIAGYLIEKNDFDRACGYAERARDQLVYKPGLSADRAAVYGNLFTIYLERSQELTGQDRKVALDTAEGYFFESNLNYLGQSQLRGPMTNLFTLFSFTLKQGPDWSGLLPPIANLYAHCYRLWRRDPDLEPFMRDAFFHLHGHLFEEEREELLEATAPTSAALASAFREQGRLSLAFLIRFSVLTLASKYKGDQTVVTSMYETMASPNDDVAQVLTWFQQELEDSKGPPLAVYLQGTDIEHDRDTIEQVASETIERFGGRSE
ncbi:SIR2 family protein [Halobellus captivus]|uniref:SIR2 family protein n=1 Tax=Halobellus captivus TaxID=2592614 RepID=UPI00119DE4D5|nr:SIR2 family protein [Halobellus captivus]